MDPPGGEVVVGGFGLEQAKKASPSPAPGLTKSETKSPGRGHCFLLNHCLAASGWNVSPGRRKRFPEGGKENYHLGEKMMNNERMG